MSHILANSPSIFDGVAFLKYSSNSASVSCSFSRARFRADCSKSSLLLAVISSTSVDTGEFVREFPVGVGMPAVSAMASATVFVSSCSTSSCTMSVPSHSSFFVIGDFFIVLFCWTGP
eukprot:SAG11_NODE_102_length_16709_cov_31.066093_16_plen_118_part_00